MSTRANPPIGSKSGSAAATRSSNGPVLLSVGSESNIAASASAKLSPATTITDFGHDRAPHQPLAAPEARRPTTRAVARRVREPALAPERERHGEVRLESIGAEEAQRVCHSSIRGLAPGPAGQRLCCKALSRRRRSAVALVTSAPIRKRRSRRVSRRARRRAALGGHLRRELSARGVCPSRQENESAMLDAAPEPATIEPMKRARRRRSRRVGELVTTDIDRVGRDAASHRSKRRHASRHAATARSHRHRERERAVETHGISTRRARRDRERAPDRPVELPEAAPGRRS